MTAENSVHFIGNIGKAPEHRMTPKGTDALSFSIAVNKFGQKREEKPMWLDITIYGKRADALKDILTSGMKVAIEGNLETYEYESKKNPGTTVRGFGIVANDISILSSKKSSASNESEAEDTEEEQYPF